MAGKKFYWLKLKRDFFKRHDIRIIEEMPNGKDYVLFYLKLLLESIDHEGSLRFSDTIPYNEQMLSVITNTNVDIVRSAMKLFIDLRMIEIFDDKTIFMGEVEKMIGSESESAVRMRRLRQNQRASLCDGDVQKSDIEIEEEKEKESDIDIEIERKTEYPFAQPTERDSDMFSTGFSTFVDKRENQRRILMQGELGKGVVLLSQAQIDDLLDKLSIEEFDHYVGVVADCILSGKRFKRKTHYQAILDMAAADRRTK
jgi:predicted phage replisome organizer